MWGHRQKGGIGGGSRSCAALTRVRNAERCGVYAAAASEQLMLGGGGREGRGGCHISESNSAAPPRASRRLGFSRVRVRRSTAARAHSYTHHFRHQRVSPIIDRPWDVFMNESSFVAVSSPPSFSSTSLCFWEEPDQ